MDFSILLGFINLLFVGILAGEEFTIRFGVRGPLASLDDRAHIQFRQALIYRLRVLVPAIFFLALLSGIAATVANGFNPGFAFRCVGLLLLLSFILLTLFGTVPINAAALHWIPSAPLTGWRSMIKRWEQLDDIRCGLALAAFAAFLTGMALA